MRRRLLALILGTLFAFLAGGAVAGCKEMTAKTDFCELYMRCVGFDRSKAGCKKNMESCKSAYSSEEFSAECVSKAKSLSEAGTVKPSEYCSDLCTVCD